eukprot:TRINITY_DN234_c0_g1_i2.p1 TRINITY_DN234_c0_g1~~TRINITY_DN234_c0_g1_i2.p1  ORF type:complete len:147 (-),score=45.17 TRINITY_DN234_c0_g1_i2:93-533(-)
MSLNKVMIRSVSSGAYLDGRHQAGEEAALTSRPAHGDQYLHLMEDIKLENHVEQHGGNYAFKGVASGAYLDGRHQAGETAVVTSRSPHGDNYLQWKLEFVDGNYALKGVGSGAYLDGRQQAGENPLMTNRNPNGDRFLQWVIQPVL